MDNWNIVHCYFEPLIKSHYIIVKHIFINKG